MNALPRHLSRAWLVLTVVSGGSALAATALVVPETEDARGIASSVAAQLSEMKIGAKVAGSGTPAFACLGVEAALRRNCVIDASAAYDAVVMVSVASVQGRLAVSIEAISRRARKTLAEEAVRGTPDQIEAHLKSPLAHLAALIRSTQAPRPAPPIAATAPPVQDPVSVPAPLPAPAPTAPGPAAVAVEASPSSTVDGAFVAADAPRAEAAPGLTPQTSAPPPGVSVAAAPMSTRRMLAWTTTGVAAAAVVTAIAFGALCAAEGPQLSAQRNGVSALSYGQAQTLTRQTNLHLGIAIGSGVAAAVAAAISGWLWAAD